MKKLYFLILLLLYFFILSLNIFAQESFIKYDKNPLFFSFPEGYSEIRQIHIFYEKNLFRGFFSFKRTSDDNFNIFYAESPEGINWEIKKKINTYKINSFSPRVFKRNDNVYILYFSTLEDNLYKIYKLYCNEDFNCSTSPQLVLTPEKSYESKGVFSGAHYLVDNQHYLFYGSWNGGFHINLAISTNGEDWQRCENNPILNSYDGPFLWQKNSNLYLYYHVYDSSGIKYSEITNLNGCNIQIKELGYLLQPNQNYDLYHLIFPSIIETPNNLLIFYTGLGTEGWRLNLASTNPFQILPSPTPTPNYALILLPGLMASWNKEAILYNRNVGVFDWKLLPFVKEYDGIINTLKNLGYVENQDFYLFPYDWRKSIDQSSEDLKTFIDTKITPDKKINLIGHSLGGLVGRIFTQKYKDRVNKLITIGSPHQGAVQTYKVVEAGEIERNNDLIWLAQKLILQLYKNGIKTDKQVIEEKLPVAKDLLPTFNFLKNTNGQEISIENMSIKNNTLLNYNTSFPDTFSILTTIVGEKGNTLSGYTVGQRTILDKLLGYYPDGRPIDNFYNIGDKTVLSLSAKAGNTFEILNLDHGEIMYKQEAIKKILDHLQIDYQDNKIDINGRGTKISPSLLFLLKSPARMEVRLNDQVYYPDQEGLIFIENPLSGIYKLKITGEEQGVYKIIVGEITENSDYWNTIENQTYQGKEDVYSISFNPTQPQEFFIDQDDTQKIKENIINELMVINTPLNNNLTIAIKKLKNLKDAEEILTINKHLFNAIKELDSLKWNAVLEIVAKVENLYHLSTKKAKQKPEKLIKDLNHYANRLSRLEVNLLKKQSQNEDVTKNIYFLKMGREKLIKAKLALEKKQYPYAEILLKSIQKLIILSNDI